MSNAIRQKPLSAAVNSQISIAKVSRGRPPLIQLFLQLQVMAVVADGRVDPAEHVMLVRIARRLGLNETDVSQLEALLRATTGRRSGPGGRPTKDLLADAYTALKACGRLLKSVRASLTRHTIY
ncbi:MAG: hypothetical protein ACKVJN_00450 [Woeseiales bacterium]